jgi:hypothetical protein
MLSVRLTALAAVAATLAVSGCGKSASTTTTTTSAANTQTATGQTSTEAAKPVSSTPISSAELISKANSICRRVAARRASNRAETREQIAQVASELASFERGISAELATLAPPTSLANDWQQILTGARTLASDTAKVGEYARANQLQTPAVAGIIADRAKVEHQLLVIAKHDGFTDCAQTI